MKKKFAMFCKTYRNDFNRVQQLVQSFNTFNRDAVTLYVSVPEEDFCLFSTLESTYVRILTDESYARNYFTTEKYWGLSEGYINQEICKLSFWETELCDNYLCVDSEVEFIRDFYIRDFMADEDTPYTVLVQDKDLLVEKHYQEFGVWRQSLIEKIYSEIGLDDRRYRTCHASQVMNGKVLYSLKYEFMLNKKYDYKKLIQISPYEFTWYNVWFQKCSLIKELAVEPFFKMFHMRIEYAFSRAKLISKNDLSTRYCGIILNGNWKRKESRYGKITFLQKIIYFFIERF